MYNDYHTYEGWDKAKAMTTTAVGTAIGVWAAGALAGAVVTAGAPVVAGFAVGVAACVGVSFVTDSVKGALFKKKKKK